ncbi:ABC transporter ATP-binding protein [Paractinoplanes atraurantiacus]|uniref:ABC-2 type transport system ATP-binding protein n=1 Tax=Paractinoplanes atraurantiacus TaxID=1036182 RepID=A0A285FTE2_9ACTN|nr:ATP-binding cassette domain-containing protein [Actinoplanes atraurantiacus]SNY14590.1 ABC-2 type transport system ATP-binding protein [Actinoplanes atraurantiacus]
MSVVTARGAGVRHRRRWLFQDLDVDVEPGELVAVVGPPGSGRTTALLALARRFRLSAGTVELTGTASLGYVPEVEGPEPVFTVTEHVRERLALLGRSRSAATGVPLLGLDAEKQGRDLTPYEKQILGLVLARLEEPAVIALDGVDDGLDRREREDLWELLDEIAASGTAVLVTAREIDPERVATVIRLGEEER